MAARKILVSDRNMAAEREMTAEKEDAALVDAVDAVDRYLEDHERAEKLLKQVRAVWSWFARQ
jgi:hypothetical protein